MEKKIILFDIDRTLIDNNLLGQKFDAGITALLDPSEKEKYFVLKKNYFASLAADREYSPETLISLLIQEFPTIHTDSLNNVFYGDHHVYRSVMFTDTLPTLKKLAQKYSLGIFSEGDLKFQNFKYQDLEIADYIDKKFIYIVKDKTIPDVLNGLPKDAIVVDDKEMIVKLLQKNGIKGIWLNRKSEQRLEGIPTIHTLTELESLLI